MPSTFAFALNSKTRDSKQMIRILASGALCCQMISAQTASLSHLKDQWQALKFLEGTWEAKTQQAASKISASGSYTFREDLDGHILARHTNTNKCKGPVDYDCDHSDLLYVYEDNAGQRLKAIYFDNEGHVIHYSVSSPAPSSAVFLSDPTSSGPQFRLMYQLKGVVMEGKFQMRMPGKAEWTSYLDWNGAKK